MYLLLRSSGMTKIRTLTSTSDTADIRQQRARADQWICVQYVKFQMTGTRVSDNHDNHIMTITPVAGVDQESRIAEAEPGSVICDSWFCITDQWAVDVRMTDNVHERAQFPQSVT